MALNVYSPSKVNLLIALLYQIDGYSSDAAISLTKNSQNFRTNVGSSGTVERIHNPDRTYTLEVSLAQTSPANAILTTLASLDDATKAIPFPIFAQDNSGQSLFTASWCWIEQPPTASYTNSIETRVWRIRCTGVVFGLAGNDAEQSLLEAAEQLAGLISQAGVNLGGIL